MVSSQTSTEENENFAAIIDGISSVSRYGTSPSSAVSFLQSTFLALVLSCLVLTSRKECRGFALRVERPPPKLHREVFHLQRLSDHSALQRNRGMDHLQEHGGRLRRTGDFRWRLSLQWTPVFLVFMVKVNKD